jgi:hypothetical protein
MPQPHQRHLLDYQKRTIKVVSLQHSVAGEVCSECLDVLSTDYIEMGHGTK